MERIYVTKQTGRLERTDLYLLRLSLADGTVHESLEPRRLFPVSDTQHYISLLDDKEKEVALVRDVAELDEESAAALAACFGEFYRIPYITRVLETREKFGSLTFVVETDHGGPVTFRIRNRHSDIKASGTRVLIRDASDNRYEIPNYEMLDAASKRLLFPYL